MPGGRGTIIDIAYAVSVEDPEPVVQAIKAWIDIGGYRLTVSSNDIAAAFEICTQPQSLQELWCHALRKGVADPRDY